MRSILRGMGVEFTETSVDKSNVFHFQLDGYEVALLNQDADLQLHVGFSGKVDMAKVNEWNQTYRFSRAYLSATGNSSIEADLDLRGGVTKETVETFIKQFRTTLGAYSQFLASPSAKSSTLLPTDSAQVHRKGVSATTKVKTPFGDFAVWIDPSRWKKATTESVGALQFENVSGEGFARIITERIGIPTDALSEIALANAKKVAPDATVVMKEKRIVNGRQILAMQMQGTTASLPFRYYGYYYGGASGTIQAITYTVATAFERNVDEFTMFLDGLEISDQELPPPAKASSLGDEPGVLLVNADAMAINYNSKTWKQNASKESGHFTFDHVRGDGYAMVIAERIGIPLDSLPEIALSNAKEVDPNAHITFREKRVVNGVEVWFLKLDAETSGIPITYYGYYYGGKSGTVQVLTYTGRNLVPEYEKDFMDFLNGFRVKD